VSILITLIGGCSDGKLIEVDRPIAYWVELNHTTGKTELYDIQRFATDCQGGYGSYVFIGAPSGISTEQIMERILSVYRSHTCKEPSAPRES